MNVVMIVPTGIGCAIGGDAGDATPASKLLAQCCDNLLVNPNVVNASDINEMTPNTWYVEGWHLDQFLAGKFGLVKPRRANSILLVGNRPFSNETWNARSAARGTIGADITTLGLEVPLTMSARYEGRRATGIIHGWEAACDQINECQERCGQFHAVVIHTPIGCDRDTAHRYFSDGSLVNPWGGVEAILSRTMSERLGIPVIHAPLENTDADDDELLNIYKNTQVREGTAAEAVSNCYLHCALKGAHLSPCSTDSLRQSDMPAAGMFVARQTLWCDDIDWLVSPTRCWGPPHEAFVKTGRIIFVRENKPKVPADCWATEPLDYYHVNNYLEAAGVIMAARAGVTLQSVRRN